MDPKLKKWLRWLDIIEKEVTDLVVHQNIFKEVQEIILDNNQIKDISSSFWGYFKNTYVTYIIMAIRRQVKIDKKKSISLALFLQEISENPEILSRSYYVNLYPKSKHMQELANEYFDRYSGGDKESGNYISKQMVEKNLIDLKKITKTCEKLADKKIAHIDKGKLLITPTINDARKSVDLLNKLVLKYKVIFQATSSASGTLLPTYQYDWKEIFKYPWLDY